MNDADAVALGLGSALALLLPDWVGCGEKEVLGLPEGVTDRAALEDGDVELDSVPCAEALVAGVAAAETDTCALDDAVAVALTVGSDDGEIAAV